MGGDLHKARLEWVRKELDQIGVAVSVVGTRRAMMRRLAGYLEPSIEGLRGTRPEIRKVRQSLKRAQFNILRGPITPLRASKNIWIARDLMDEVIKLKNKGLLSPSKEYFDNFVLSNTWGYSAQEIKTFRVLLNQALEGVSEELYDELVYGSIDLDPEKAKGRFFAWDAKRDVFIANPERAKSKSDIYYAFGDRIWHKVLRAIDRRTWSTKSQFLDIFTQAMKGQVLDKEEKARLQVTLGFGGGWYGAA